MYFSRRYLGRKKNVSIQHMSSLQAWIVSIFVRYTICIVDLTGKGHVEERAQIGS